MQIISLRKNEDYKELVVQYSFLGFKWKTTYRMVDGIVFRYKYPNKYFSIGFMEYSDIRNLFSIKCLDSE